MTTTTTTTTTESLYASVVVQKEERQRQQQEEEPLQSEQHPLLLSSSSEQQQQLQYYSRSCSQCYPVTEVEEEEEEDDAVAAAAAASALDRQVQVARRMRVLTFFAAIGGFLSGYNTGVIAGALLPLKRVFLLTEWQEEAIVSATIVSAFLASLAGGTINTVLGRRRTLLLAAAIFTLGAIIMFSALNYAMLVLGEVLLGMGIGLESLTSPLYIAEVAKPSIRGMLVSAYALMMCMGQFVAGIMDGVYGELLPDGWAWRCMFGTAMVPGVVMFVGFVGLPESPSWLMTRLQEDQAQTILTSVRDTDQEVYMEIQSLRHTARCTGDSDGSDDADDDKRRSSVWASFQGMVQDAATRNALVVGCGLMILQQICGVNGVLYYAASVYEMAGFAELTSIWLSAWTAFAQIIGLAASVVLIETAGRRLLVITSLMCIGICSLGLGYSFYEARVESEPTFYIAPECARQPALVWDGITRNCWDCTSIPGCGYCGNACVMGNEVEPFFTPAANNNNNNSNTSKMTCPAETEEEWSYSVCENPYGWMSVLFMVAYLIVFGIGMAGLPWTVNSEIYPVRFRSLAVSISTGTNWLSNLLISSTFLTINSPQVLTSYGAFYLYATICFVGAAAMYVYLPETKGLSMEEIEERFRQGYNHCKHRPGAPNSTGEEQVLIANPNDGTFGKSHLPPIIRRGDDTVLTCEEDSAASSYDHYGSVNVSVLAALEPDSEEDDEEFPFLSSSPRLSLRHDT